MFFSSIKEINRLINKGMSNIHLRVTIDKNWHSQNFDFLDLNHCLQFSVCGAPAHANIYQ